ncbi:MAG: ABC transporter substrate-binding protein, partial [Deltaproteobacteria bacterium]|nr:ABC transporter substrate-binding protein [Deltaproteobacteria bacterium]
MKTRKRSRSGWAIALLALSGFAVPTLALAEEVAPAHGIAMHGDLTYPAGFTQFAYANPEAPKGGALRQYAIGTFDSFNPFIPKGNPAAGLALIYDSLMTPSRDEPFSR